MHCSSRVPCIAIPNSRVVYVLAAVNEESIYGGGIVPVGMVYEIYQHKISIHPSTTKPAKYEASNECLQEKLLK